MGIVTRIVRTSKDGFSTTRKCPIFTDGIEIEMIVFKIHQFIRSLSTFGERQQFAKSFRCFFTIIGLIGAATGYCKIHQWTTCPQVIFTQITQSHYFIDAQSIFPQCSFSRIGIIPIDGQKIGCFTEICCCQICTFMII
ncbi:hypothetical protein D3C72_1782980 [compost metagenome]